MLVSWLDDIFETVIDLHLKRDRDGGDEDNKNKECKDFVQLLLQLKEGDPNRPITMARIKALLWVRFSSFIGQQG